MKHQNQRIIATLLLASLMGLTSVAKDKLTEKIPPSVSIQEQKFEDLRPSEEKKRFNNLKPLIEMIKHELFEAGFSVKDEADMVDAQKEQEKSQVMDGVEGDEKVEGNLKIPAFFLRLKVLQYGFQSVSQNNVMSGNTTKKQFLSAQMTSTIVDVRSGRLIGSANVKAGPLELRTLSGPTGGQSGNYDEQMLQTLNQQCAQQIVAYLTKKTPAKFRPEGASGKVLKVADYGVLVKINPEKVKVGDVLDIFKTESLNDDDDDDEDDDDEDLVEEIYVGSASVSEIKKKYVVCVPMPESKSAKFEKKQLARPSTRYKPGKPAASSSSANAATDPF